MINYGTSAYLKLISLNPKPQRTEVLNRLAPSDGGYDFHAEMRRLANTLMLVPNSEKEVTERVKQIRQGAEKKSAALGIANLMTWHRENRGHTYIPLEHKYVSPNELFSVKFSPVFGYMIGGQKLAIHVWNTKTAKLTHRSTQALLSLFVDKYQTGELPAILCLRSNALYVLEAKSDTLALGDIFSSHIENLITELGDPDGKGPKPPTEPPSIHPPSS